MTGAPAKARRRGKTSSQQCATQNEQRHVEIDYQASNIDQCSNEWRGRRRRIQSETTQQERKHRSAESAPQYHSDKRGADGKSNQPMIFPVVKNMQILPERDSEKTNGSKNQAKGKSREKFLADHTKPVNQTQFAQSHRPDNQCCCLRSGIAAPGNDERQKHRQNRGLLDLAVITLHRRGGEHFSEKENDQPGRSFLYHAQQRDGGVRLVQRFHAANFLDVFGRL